MVNNFNLNTPNFLTNGLKEAFDAARYGDDTNPATALLDQVFGPLRGTKSGASYLRTTTAYPGMKTSLANGNYSALASSISSLAQPNAPAGTTNNGWLLRTAGLPENFIVTNPQFGTVNLRTNWGKTNYHAMQTQVSMRPTAGVSFQLSYTWSKTLGNLGAAGYTDPRNRAGDYTVQGSDRPHVLTSYGTFDLPLGPNKLFFGKSSGFVARLLENWQANWIATVSSGTPINVTTAASMLYGTGVPDQVGDFPFDKIGVYWEEGAREGNYFAKTLQVTKDPQTNPNKVTGFGKVTATDSLNTSCTLMAVADVNGNIILQNPLPGTRGSFGFNRFYGPMSWNVDMSISKSVKIGESKSISVRIDSTNLFNHPLPSGALNAASTRVYFASAPLTVLNSANTYLGTFATKVGQRVFQARIRLSF